MFLHHIVTFGDTLLHWQGQALQVSLSLSGIRGQVFGKHSGTGSIMCLHSMVNSKHYLLFN